ncbi:MAG: membrane dipeptidase [Candidatus Aminicenantes bacterium]|nr:MAG: membrane dipeptidase [Candidatus Aminicenantes bacterium]
MKIKRRDFLKMAGSAAIGSTALTGYSAERIQESFDPLNEKGIHPSLEKDHPFIFIDSCMQIWPDAQFQDAHRYGATSYAVTAWDPHLDLDLALEGLMFWHLIARKYPDLSIVYTVEDITKAKNDKKATLLLVSQCGDFIGYKIHRIAVFYRLGLRMMIPAYSLSNRICGGCLDRTDQGLTSFGKLVVAECNRIGLLLDCSHLGKRSSFDIIGHSQDPVVFSHSCTKALAENPRNITDEQIKACAAKNGIIGLSPWGPMVMKTGQIKRPTVDDFIDHIDHAAQILGSTDNIGVGTDMSLGTYPDHEYDPWGSPVYKDVTGTYDKYVTSNIRSPLRMVEGFSNYAEVLNFVEKLEKRGYSNSDVQKILGLNYLRVFGQVWK